MKKIKLIILSMILTMIVIIGYIVWKSGMIQEKTDYGTITIQDNNPKKIPLRFENEKEYEEYEAKNQEKRDMYGTEFANSVQLSKSNIQAEDLTKSFQIILSEETDETYIKMICDMVSTLSKELSCPVEQIMYQSIKYNEDYHSYTYILKCNDAICEVFINEETMYYNVQD